MQLFLKQATQWTLRTALLFSPLVCLSPSFPMEIPTTPSFSALCCLRHTYLYSYQGFKIGLSFQMKTPILNTVFNILFCFSKRLSAPKTQNGSHLTYFNVFSRYYCSHKIYFVHYPVFLHIHINFCHSNFWGIYLLVIFEIILQKTSTELKKNRKIVKLKTFNYQIFFIRCFGIFKQPQFSKSFYFPYQEEGQKVKNLHL